MIWTNGSHESAKFQTFDCSLEISPNLYFDRLLLLWLMTLNGDGDEQKMICFKIDKNLVNFDPSTQVSKICTFIGPFRAKYITFNLKKYRRVIFHQTEEWYKIWRKTNLWFGKWHEEFGKFHQSTQKPQNWDFDGKILPKVENAWA